MGKRSTTLFIVDEECCALFVFYDGSDICADRKTQENKLHPS